MAGELLKQSISSKMNYVLFTNILQGADTAGETALQKQVLKNFWLKP